MIGTKLLCVVTLATTVAAGPRLAGTRAVSGDNLKGDAADRDVFVFLPPSYAKENRCCLSIKSYFDSSNYVGGALFGHDRPDEVLFLKVLGATFQNGRNAIPHRPPIFPNRCRGENGTKNRLLPQKKQPRRSKI